MQDCDYLINYDIHWNPVRIIQRFGRIDRIGSKNDVIQLVNYWPDMELDDYIKLKGRVESRMKAQSLPVQVMITYCQLMKKAIWSTAVIS